MIAVGIDTGTNTGLALWDCDSRKFLSIESCDILDAIDVVRQLVAVNGKDQVLVRFEDARQRKWIPREHDMSQRVGRAIGAGHVQRDAAIWEEFCKKEGIQYEAVAPKHNATKMSAGTFKGLTKWEERTNEHERDAAMLVFGLKGRRAAQ